MDIVSIWRDTPEESKEGTERSIYHVCRPTQMKPTIFSFDMYVRGPFIPDFSTQWLYADELAAKKQPYFADLLDKYQRISMVPSAQCISDVVGIVLMIEPWSSHSETGTLRPVSLCCSESWRGSHGYVSCNRQVLKRMNHWYTTPLTMLFKGVHSM